MKRTELERRMRQLKRDEKQANYIEKVESSRDARSVANYIDELFSLLYYNEQEIMNIADNVEILELLEDLKEEHPEKQWHNVLKKAVPKTGVKKRDEAIDELTELLEM
jgi:hypothetical protein